MFSTREEWLNQVALHCGYTARITRKWLDETGAPLCPGAACDHAQMAEG